MIRLALIAGVLMLAAGDAHAYHPVTSFEKTANEGGGGGMYFTGSPRQKGYDCTICHIDGDRTLALALDSPIAGGAYVPSMRYDVTVRMVGEHRGGGSGVDENTFLAEFLADGGDNVGEWFGTNEDIFRVIDDGRVLATRGLGGGEVEWTFVWTAPQPGTGPITLYIAALDGDGASGSAGAATDPLNDDTAELTLRLCEGSSGCAPAPELDDSKPTSAAKCALVQDGEGGGATGAAFVAMLALLAFTSKRRRALALFAVLFGGGCFDPTVAAECPSRVCGDAGLALLDAREGPGCQENWVCTPWQAPLGSDDATRMCVDSNDTGTEDCKPEVGPVTLPGLDMNYYKCRVSPILQRGCSMMACHGTEDGRTFRTYARGRLRNDEVVNRTGTCIPMNGTVNLQEAGSGTVMCEGWLPHTQTEWKRNFDSARSFMLGVDNPDDSEMLRQPVVGGLPHVEVKPFTADGGDYQTVKAWLGGASLGACDTGYN